MTMKKRGFTLIELVITMVLIGILILAMSCQFVALVRFNPATESADGTRKESAVASREALVVMRHMTRVLRFAKPDSISVSIDSRIAAAIEGGHLLNLVPNDLDSFCYYRLDKTEMPYKFFSVLSDLDVPFQQSPDEILLSSNVTSFLPTWDPATKLLTLKLEFTDKKVTLPVETVIRVLGSES